jgi:hypothetical protein
VVQPEGLKCRIKSMMQMEPQQSKTAKINIIVCRDLEQAMGGLIKIFSIAFYNSQLNKIEIEKMQDQEYHNSRTCPYHKARK